MKPIAVALVVQNCPAGCFDRNLESTLDFISQSARDRSDIVVFPEMNLTGYVAGEDVLRIARPITPELISLMSKTAVGFKITLMVGLAEKSDAKFVYATHLVFKPDGQWGRYRKIHISPFEKTYFAAGDNVSLFESHGMIFGVQLCYDAHFPELSLAMALKGADAIFIPHASPRGSAREKADSWVRHLKARAFDNGLFIAALNQKGDNGKGLRFPGVGLLIGPDGNMIYLSTDDDERIHMVHMDPAFLASFRSHPMRYFLPHRRPDLFNI